MDIKVKIDEIVEKIKGDPGFAEKFASDPVKAVESIIGIDLPDDQINPLVEGIKAKLSSGIPGDILDNITKLF